MIKRTIETLLERGRPEDSAAITYLQDALDALNGEDIPFPTTPYLALLENSGQIAINRDLLVTADEAVRTTELKLYITTILNTLFTDIKNSLTFTERMLFNIGFEKYGADKLTVGDSTVIERITTLTKSQANVHYRTPQTSLLHVMIKKESNRYSIHFSRMARLNSFAVTPLYDHFPKLQAFLLRLQGEQEKIENKNYKVIGHINFLLENLVIRTHVYQDEVAQSYDFSPKNNMFLHNSTMGENPDLNLSPQQFIDILQEVVSMFYAKGLLEE